MNIKDLSSYKLNLDIVLRYYNSPLVFYSSHMHIGDSHIEIGHFRSFQTSVSLTLTLTLNHVIRHTVVYHFSTSTYIYQMLFMSEKLFVDVRTHVLTGLRPALLGGLGRENSA